MIRGAAEQVSKRWQANGRLPGDIIDPGAPEDVGPGVRGDVIGCHVDGLPNLAVKTVRARRTRHARACRKPRGPLAGRPHRCGAAAAPAAQCEAPLSV